MVVGRRLGHGDAVAVEVLENGDAIGVEGGDGEDGPVHGAEPRDFVLLGMVVADVEELTEGEDLRAAMAACRVGAGGGDGGAARLRAADARTCSK